VGEARSYAEAMRLCKQADPATGASPCFLEEGHNGCHAWELDSLPGFVQRAHSRSQTALQPVGGWAVTLVVAAAVLVAGVVGLLLVLAGSFAAVQ
jgi:hypothetical protein